ncbi:MAG: response regulator [Pseudomonadota bacterium]
MENQYQRDQSLFIVDDDAYFTRAATRALAKRGFEPQGFASLAEAVKAIDASPPAYAIFDLRLKDGSGLDLVDHLRRVRPDARSVVLTGYGDLSTAVSATKLGAVDYLTKPAEADAIAAALKGENKTFVRSTEMSRPEVQELRYLLSIFEAQDRNMSRTARLISKHRRSLQRILRRYGVREEQNPGENAITNRQRIRRMLKFWRGMLEGELHYDDQKITIEQRPVIEEPRDRRSRRAAARRRPDETNENSATIE